MLNHQGSTPESKQSQFTAYREEKPNDLIFLFVLLCTGKYAKGTTFFILSELLAKVH